MCIKYFVLNFVHAKCSAPIGVKTFDLVPFKICGSLMHHFSEKPKRRCARFLQYVMEIIQTE